MNPIQKAAFDIKYQLFNRTFSTHEVDSEVSFFEDNSQSDQKFHIKILVEIVSMFHFLNDLRQQYLVLNNIQFFYKNIFLPNKENGYHNFQEEDYQKMNNILSKEFLHIIPDADSFHKHLKYELPSLDTMYDNNQLDGFKAKIISKSTVEFFKKSENSNIKELSVQEMHDEFVALMIDTFNMHSYDPYLRQLTILLIARYHSERAEFIRNLDRTLLFFDQNDWLFYQWVQQQLDKFQINSEKSNIWLLKIKSFIENANKNSFEDAEVTKGLINLKEILSSFKRAVVYNCRIEVDEDNEEQELLLIHEKGDRKVRFYAQNLFRNLKVYDYMINFLFQNKELLLKVRSIDFDSLNDNQKNIVKMVKKIFKKIFRILEVMTVNNSKTQELMWKYKEEFVFEKLGMSEQEGELDLVLAIIDDSQDAIKYHQNKWTLTKTR